jgi:predicted MPP superfamily phosphohydrolase
MQSDEKLRVLILFSLICAVYVFAIGSIIRLLLRRFGFIKRPESIFQVWFRRIIFSLAILGFFCFGYAYFVEPYWLDVRKVEIQSEKIKQPFRIVHISDIHSDEKPRLEEKLAEAIANEKPDLILFSGDSINSPQGLPVFRKCLTEIAKIAPTYVVRGNWDLQTPKLFDETGAIQLSGNIENLEIKGNKLSILGYSAFNSGNLRQSINNFTKETYNIFVYHFPDEIENISQSDTDLYCAGHTHGGQIRLPFYGALVTLSKFGKKYESGTFKVENTWLNVNRGIGMEGEEAPRIRFFCRPEITVIDVLPN